MRAFGDNGSTMEPGFRNSAYIPLILDALALEEDELGRMPGFSEGDDEDSPGGFPCQARPRWVEAGSGRVEAIRLAGSPAGSDESFATPYDQESLAPQEGTYYAILVTDLTMMHEGRVCLAGVDMRDMRDIRPTRGAAGLTLDDLRVMGGAIKPGCALVFESPALPLEVRRPHVEDVPFEPSSSKVLYRMFPEEVHHFLQEIARPGLYDIYGTRMRDKKVRPERVGRSLGTLACSRVRAWCDSRGKLRIDVMTRDRDTLTNLPYNDYLVRTYIESAGDAATRHKRLEKINEDLNRGGFPIARVGLTRPFDPTGEGMPFCWLQVNAVYPALTGDRLENV